MKNGAVCPKCYAQFKGRGIGQHILRCPKGVTREDLFWQKVANGAPDACWPSLGAITTHGYGCFGLGRGLKVIGAHKAAYQYAKGLVQDGMEIMHSCDNRRCCNPAHLSTGTRQDNADDKVAKGRSARRKVHWKLTAAQVIEIRSLRGIEGSGSLSKRFGVEQPHIINIWNRKTWRALP